MNQEYQGATIDRPISSQVEYAAWRQGVIKSYADEIRRGKLTLSSLTTENQAAVLAYMNSPEGKANGKHVYLKQQRESRDMQRKHAKEWKESGIPSYRPGQETYTTAVRKHLDGCEAGEYPSAKSTAEAVAGENAKKLLSKQNPKRVKRAFEENRNHPGMQLVVSIADRSSIAALTAGRFSTCLGALAASHKLAHRIEVLERKQAQQEEHIRNLLNRRDREDAGKDWREEAARIREAEPGISNRKLADKVGVSEGTIRNYLKSLRA